MSPPCLTLALGLLLLAGTHAQIMIYNLHAKNLPNDALGISDGYVKVSCGSEDLGRTSVCNNDMNPWWPEDFTSFNAVENDTLKLEVFDQDIVSDDHIGTCLRTVERGTHQHECFLEKGGTLTYTYTLHK